MRRTALGLGVLAVLLVITGCTMCCHPYDYCGPVFHGGGCQACSPHGRVGSILSEASELAPLPPESSRPEGGTLSHADIENHVRGEMRQDDVPGSQKIVSITDQVVEPPIPSADPPQVADGSSLEPSKVLPSQGWMARRPTTERLR